MRDRLRALISRTAVKRRLTIALLASLAVWFAFFDSHSLLKRVQYARERSTLQHEVEELRSTNEMLERRVAEGVTDELVEKVAREQYGMRRAGETVYPIEDLDE